MRAAESNSVRPATRTWPRAGRISPDIAWSVSDLPAPDGPYSATTGASEANAAAKMKRRFLSLTVRRTSTSIIALLREPSGPTETEVRQHLVRCRGVEEVDELGGQRFLPAFADHGHRIAHRRVACRGQQD